MRALLIVDIQNDFISGGALAVPQGEQTVALANELMPHFDLCVATQDFHPQDHGSFAPNSEMIGQIIDLNGLDQVLWPKHCVQGTFGAEFVEGLNVDKIDKVIPKGVDRNIDSYSGFFDNGGKQETGLNDYLQSKNIAEVFVIGLATDYCVKFTALDAVNLNYKTTLVEDACRGVNLQQGDVDRALADMEKAGVKIINSADILAVEGCL